MFGSTVIDTAVGLAFVYLVVSLACTALKEAIELWWTQRANFLREGLARLMGGDDPRAADWLAKLYQEPLLQSLCRSGWKWPSYIPSGLFARALVALVRKEGAAAAPPAPVGHPVKDFLALVNAVPNAAVRGAILAAVRDAAGTMEQVENDIEAWFDGAMDRVSGWYKRWSQGVILVLGALVVGGLNVDTIALGRVLWTDPVVREAVAEDARAAIARGQADVKAAPKEGEAADPLGGVKEARTQLAQLGLPIGWDRHNRLSMPADLDGWLFKLLGLAITTLAVSLGAPFWFDTLNRVMVVRSTVKPKEKSPDEPPVDR